MWSFYGCGGGEVKWQVWPGGKQGGREVRGRWWGGEGAAAEAPLWEGKGAAAPRAGAAWRGR
jgi:hypothetical protein